MELHDPRERALTSGVGCADPEPIARVLHQFVHAVRDAVPTVDGLEPVEKMMSRFIYPYYVVDTQDVLRMYSYVHASVLRKR